MIGGGEFILPLLCNALLSVQLKKMIFGGNSVLRVSAGGQKFCGEFVSILCVCSQRDESLLCRVAGLLAADARHLLHVGAVLSRLLWSCSVSHLL